MYISWSNTSNAPIRQLVGVKRQPAIPPAKSANVSLQNLVLSYGNYKVFSVEINKILTHFGLHHLHKQGVK